jgi:undecaprenyl-diphosphatase
MISYISAFFLGLLQGITEFLPVSSSGHLVLAQHFLNFREQSLLFDVWLHFGTLLAILVVLYRPVLRLLDGIWKWVTSDPLHPFRLMNRPEGQNTYLLWVVLVATIPTAVIGFTFKDTFEHLFEGNLVLLGMAFLFTALLLFMTRFRKGDKAVRGIHITYLQAFSVGIIQGIAIIPGVSRSGSTIALALLLGLSRKEAGEFSFLIVIPAILGAMLLETLHSTAALRDPHFLGPAFMGMLVAFGVGILTLKALLHIVNRGSLYRFSYYCLCLGALSLWIGR